MFISVFGFTYTCLFPSHTLHGTLGISEMCLSVKAYDRNPANNISNKHFLALNYVLSIVLIKKLNKATYIGSDIIFK